MRTKLTAFIMCAFTVILISSCAGSKPSGVVKKFYQAMGRGDMTAATELMSSSLVAQYGPKLQAGLVQQAQAIRTRGGITTVTIISEEALGETATVVAEVTFGNGTSERTTNKLLKENGKWRLTEDK